MDGFETVLTTHGFDAYVPVFRLHAIRIDVLGQLTADDLLEVGVDSLGKRVRILKLIDAFVHKQAPPSRFARPSYQRAVFSTPSLQTDRPAPPAPGPLGPLPDGLPEVTASELKTRSLSVPDSMDSKPRLPPASVHEENLVLRERLEANERQIKRLNDVVAKLRYDLFRRFKEAEPLPNPHDRHADRHQDRHQDETSPSAPNSASSVTYNYPVVIPGSSGSVTPSTPNVVTLKPAKPHLVHQVSSSTLGTVKRQDSRRRSSSSQRSPQDGYFTRSASASSAYPSSPAYAPSINRANSAAGHSLHTLPTAMPSSPSGPYAYDHNGSHQNLSIQQHAEPFKKFRCGEADNAARVLSSMFRRYHLDGELSQWRLQIMYGEKARDLLDHEVPLVVFKQLQEQGHKPMFHAKKIQPPRPPPESYI